MEIINLKEKDKLTIKLSCGCEFILDTEQMTLFITGLCKKHNHTKETIED